MFDSVIIIRVTNGYIVDPGNQMEKYVCLTWADAADRIEALFSKKQEYGIEAALKRHVDGERQQLQAFGAVYASGHNKDRLPRGPFEQHPKNNPYGDTPYSSTGSDDPDKPR